MKFFFDNCISPRLARAIHQLIQPKHSAIPLRDRFHADTPDNDWLSELGNETRPGTDDEWVVISGELRIKTRPLERAAWKQAGLTIFFMADGFVNQPEWEQVRWIIDKWPAIMDQVKRVTAGSGFIVPKKGKKLTTV